MVASSSSSNVEDRKVLYRDLVPQDQVVIAYEGKE